MPHLGHVHLKVSDVDRSVAFYTDVFELSVTERHGQCAFLSFGEHHHDVALQGVGRTHRAGAPGSACTTPPSRWPTGRHCGHSTSG